MFYNKKEESYEANELDNWTSFSDGFEILIKYAKNDNFVIVIDKVSFLTQSYKDFLYKLHYKT